MPFCDPDPTTVSKVPERGLGSLFSVLWIDALRVLIRIASIHLKEVSRFEHVVVKQVLLELQIRFQRLSNLLFIVDKSLEQNITTSVCVFDRGFIQNWFLDSFQLV